jgi:hypothetical protein
MAYVPLDTARPVVSNVRSTDIAAMNANQLALRDSVIMGRVPGWTMTVSGGTAEEPTYRLWTNTANTNQILRAQYTWASGYISVVTWTYSTTGSGGTFDAVATETITRDGSENQTTSTNASMLSWFYEWVGKFKALRTLFTAHNGGAVGTYHSGVGTIASQAANSVTITGGSVNGTAVGTSAAAEGLFTRACEQFNSGGVYSPSSGASVAVSWLKGGSSIVNSGTNAITFADIPASRIATHMVYCTVFNSCTWPSTGTPVDWGLGGKPSIAGKAIVSFVSIDGGSTVKAGIYWREN